MAVTDNKTAYLDLFQSYLDSMPLEQAARRHVGNPKRYEEIGAIERAILEKYGLEDGQYVIDVGCGSGRLTRCLTDFAQLKYLGIDIVPDLVKLCRETFRDDWQFEVADDFKIPEEDNSADFVVAFSLFTHLLHEECYEYLKEFHRVTKPNGKIIFSFLDYRVPSHRSIFMSNVRDFRARKQLLTYMGLHAIEFFSNSLGMKITDIADGDDDMVQFTEPQTLRDGTVLQGSKTLGQSVCVLQKT